MTRRSAVFGMVGILGLVLIAGAVWSLRPSGPHAMRSLLEWVELHGAAAWFERVGEDGGGWDGLSVGYSLNGERKVLQIDQQRRGVEGLTPAA